MKLLRRIGHWVGIARPIAALLLVALLGLRIWDPAAIEALRLRTFDVYQTIKPRGPGPRPAVIVDIDEASLKAYGQWPWPRTLIADLVNKLVQAGTAAIAFDIVFAEPDRMSPALAADSFRDLDAETRAKLKTLPSNDDVLAEAIRRGRVVVGQSGIINPTRPPAEPLQHEASFAMVGGDPKPFLLTFPGLLRNVPVLEAAATGHGLFTIRPERDGIVRRVPLVMVAEGRLAPALSLEALRVGTGADTILLRTEPAGLRSVAVPGIQIPTDRNAQLFVHFSGHEPGRFVSAKDVLEGKVGADRLGRRLALIGTSAAGLLDIKTTPLDAVVPGVEIHAEVLENVLGRDLLSYPNYAIAAELVMAALAAFVVIVLAPILGAAAMLVLAINVTAALLAFAGYMYVYERVLIDASFPLLASLVVFLTLVFTNYFREQMQRRYIRSAFSQYLSPALVEQLASSPERLVLGGEQRTMTVMFSDVRGFTSISEQYKADPQGLTTLMNRLLTPLTNAIVEHKGTIDKYMGDAIMAFWNAPLDDTAHQLNACAAALEMQKRLDALNRAREQEAKANGHAFLPLNIGVGLNTGTCVVGNMGSDLRFNYSILGDAVNVASRLEGQTKGYGVQIIAGAQTAAAADGRFAMVEIDLIAVKGKTEPEAIYTMVGDAETAQSEPFRALRDLAQRMIAAYRARDWEAALAAAEAGYAGDEGLGLKKVFALYRERILAFQQEPPPPDWNGVYVAETK